MEYTQLFMNLSFFCSHPTFAFYLTHDAKFNKWDLYNNYKDFEGDFEYQIKYQNHVEKRGMIK